MQYSLIERNDDFVVINKAPGVTVQRDDGQHGLLEKVASDLGLEKLFPVHRLDKPTSGVLLMACRPESNQVLSGLFQAREVEKYYLALSFNKPKKKQGSIKGDMEKARRGSWKLTTTQKNPAVTQFFSQSLAPGVRSYLLKPHTGKTHQLRVAMRSLGAPILGDKRYGGEDSDRTYLHAWQLSFPWNGETKRFKALPEQGEYFLNPAFFTSIEPWGKPELLEWPKI
ncbi:TIGR01621 family pseudouridine synthase [Aestuariicella sp. G3-2]|uniref:TIGR01621 family pseudouridine synthase n=1 Tax=Pseudomaricurvus albidus TaxID=2842452 RepID=UPI001C0C1986|nr:TIGR01621 family pseudouridine synthase [Aestuariicella albida]MBU3070053.1 TIGR01621 family pseudouridine synthase [Aestuariicella albida]